MTLLLVLQGASEAGAGATITTGGARLGDATIHTVTIGDATVHTVRTGDSTVHTVAVGDKDGA